MASQIYYPEMGGKADEKALFQTWHVINSTYAVKWTPERDAEARAHLKTLRIRPRGLELAEQIDGSQSWSGCITCDAQSKLFHAGLISHQMLLD